MPEQETWQSRTRLLLGDEALERLASSAVFIAGVGGVGGYAAEMLARSGVGRLTLVDADCVATSNLNRQIIATLSGVGRPKVDLFGERFRDINPDISVRCVREFITPENAAGMIEAGHDGQPFDYVIDAIDTVAPKMAIITHCLRNGVRIISSMGAGGRLDVTKVGYFDVWDTREDGLARVVRQRLKQAGMRRPLQVVASVEAPRRSAVVELDLPGKRSSYGTLATIPSLFGIYLANKVLTFIVQKSF